jgi:hypothetical protein
MSKTDLPRDDSPTASEHDAAAEDKSSSGDRPKEIGGRKGPDPTRYGDWEKGGRCIDF